LLLANPSTRNFFSLPASLFFPNQVPILSFHPGPFGVHQFFPLDPVLHALYLFWHFSHFPALWHPSGFVAGNLHETPGRCPLLRFPAAPNGCFCRRQPPRFFYPHPMDKNPPHFAPLHYFVPAFPRALDPRFSPRQLCRPRFLRRGWALLPPSLIFHFPSFLFFFCFRTVPRVLGVGFSFSVVNENFFFLNGRSSPLFFFFPPPFLPAF